MTVITQKYFYYNLDFLLDRSRINWYTINMNRLNYKEQAQILRCLVEGNSIRSTARICGRSKDTVMKLMVDVGRACSEYQDKHIRNLKSKRIECDEIWSFCHSKKKNVPDDKVGRFGYGDVWTWTAIDPDSKLIVSYLVGDRSYGTAEQFINDLSLRLANKVQLTTDGYKVYLDAVENAFGVDIDYAMLVKMYGTDENQEKRYSPSQFIAAESRRVTGNPDSRYVSTSHAERHNLTIRMSNRRFTRLTNAFSKKVENLIYSVALTFMHYNFCRIHSSLRVTPAMEAGITDHVWDLEDVAKLVDKEI